MTETDPTELMKKHDEAIRIENALSGLSEDGTGVANPGKHYIQLIEARYPNNSFQCMQIIILQGMLENL